MDNKQAIKPSFYQEFTSGVEEIEEENEIDENTQALSYITHYKGWQLLKEYKERLEEYLDSMVSESIASGASFEDVGQRTLVKELTKYVLNSFVSKAEDARRVEDK